MKSKLLLVSMVAALLVGGCNNKKSTNGSNTSGSVEEVEDYDSWIAKWSKPGHLYLHYLRPEASIEEYNNWCIWIWQNAPKDLEGSLWGAGNVPNLIPMSTTYMKGIEGRDSDIDQHGVIYDIDLYADNLVGGKTGKSVSFEGATKVGFLIVDQSSMGGGTMWTSDGGAETYINNFDKLLDTSGYVHVYCVQGSVASYTTDSGTASPELNPTVTDKTGQYRSQNDITDLKKTKYSHVSTSETFLKDQPGVGYQIFVPSFADSDGNGTGDIRGIINKLDYLDELGVKCLWLTPIQESGSYHGYDVIDYYKVDPKFGTTADYEELIYKAHKKGMKVLMDMVINHTSKNNVLFKKSQKAAVETINGKEINYRNMYQWKYLGDEVRVWNGKGSNSDYQNGKSPTYSNVKVENTADWYRDGESNYYYYGKFGSGMAELNYSNQATRDYMTDMCKYWLSFGLDGFRLDAIKHIYLSSELSAEEAQKYSSDYVTSDIGYRDYYDEEKLQEVHAMNDYTYDRDLNVAFWKDFAGTIKASYPNCFLVGENFDGWNERIAPFYQSMDSQFDFSTYYHLNEVTPSGLAADIQATLNYNKAQRVNHINGAITSNHDIARMLNHAGAIYAGDKTSHTSTITSLNQYGANNFARYAAAITILTPGMSWIYYGDELGMSGNIQEVGNGNNTDRWYRQPMKWGDELGKNGVVDYQFASYQVEWDDYNKTLANVETQKADENSMYSLFKGLNNCKNSELYPTYGYITKTGSVNGNANTTYMRISDGTHTVDVYASRTNNTLSLSTSGTLLYASKGSSASSLAGYGVVVVSVN